MVSLEINYDIFTSDNRNDELRRDAGQVLTIPLAVVRQITSVTDRQRDRQGDRDIRQNCHIAYM